MSEIIWLGIVLGAGVFGIYIEAYRFHRYLEKQINLISEQLHDIKKEISNLNN